jgi:hypothetical protein
VVDETPFKSIVRDSAPESFKRLHEKLNAAGEDFDHQAHSDEALKALTEHFQGKKLKRVTAAYGIVVVAFEDAPLALLVDLDSRMLGLGPPYPPKAA